MILETFFLSTFSPFALFFLEKIFPYPYLVEELTKSLFIFYLNSRKIKKEFLMVIIFSLGFTFSEAIIYLNQILFNNDIFLFFFRIFLTGFLHFFTLLIIYFFSKFENFFVVFGLILAVIFHYYFNYLVAKIFL